MLLQNSGFNISTSLLSTTISNLPLGITADEMSIHIDNNESVLDEPTSPELDKEENTDISKMAMDTAKKEVRSHRGRGL